MKHQILLLALLTSPLMSADFNHLIHDSADVMLDIKSLKPGDVAYNGTGCPPTTAEISFDEDGNLMVTPTIYLAQSHNQFVRQTCNIAWSVPGLSGPVILLDDIVTGQSSLESGASATIMAENFFAGAVGETQVSVLNGPSVKPISLVAPPPSPPVHDGANLILRINTSIVLKPTGEDQWSIFSWNWFSSWIGKKTPSQTNPSTVTITHIKISRPMPISEQ